MSVAVMQKAFLLLLISAAAAAASLSVAHKLLVTWVISTKIHQLHSTGDVGNFNKNTSANSTGDVGNFNENTSANSTGDVGAVAALDKLEEFNTCSFDGEKGRPCQNAFRQVYPQLVGDCGNFTKYMRCLKTACGDIPALLFPNLKAAGLNKTETATCDLKEFGDSDAGDGGGGAGGGGDGGAGGGGGGGGSGGIKLQSSIMVLLTTISLIYCI